MAIDAAKVKAKAEEIIYNRLGTNLAPGEPKYVESKRTWSVPLELDLPRVVEDKRTKQLKYVVFHLGSVGSIEIDNRVLKPTGIPKRSDLNSTVEDKLLQIRSKVENLLLHTASLQFAKLVSIKHMKAKVLRHKYLRWCVVHQTVVGMEIRDKRSLNGCRIVRLDATLLRKVDLEKLRFYFLANSGRRPQNEFFWKKGSGKVVRIRSR